MQIERRNQTAEVDAGVEMSTCQQHANETELSSRKIAQDLIVADPLIFFLYKQPCVPNGA